MCVCAREQVSVWDVLSVLFCYSMLAATYYSRVYLYPLFSCCCRCLVSASWFPRILAALAVRFDP